MDKWQKTAIEKIRAVLQEKGISQHDLVRGAGFGKGHLNEVLSGKRPLTRQFVKRFADYFEMDSDWYYSEDKPDVVAPIILEAIERGVAQVVGRSNQSLSPAKQKLIDLIPSLDDSMIETFLAVATPETPAILSDQIKRRGPRTR